MYYVKQHATQILILRENSRRAKMSLRVSLIARYGPRSWLSSSGALPNYRAWHLYFVNQSTSRYDNSVMNNICAVGVVRAYLSSRMYVPSNRGSHTGYWLSRAAIIIQSSRRHCYFSVLQYAFLCILKRVYPGYKFCVHISRVLYYREMRVSMKRIIFHLWQ